MSNYSVGDFIVAPGRCLGMISSVHKKEVTIIWKDNELSAKYTFSQIKGLNYQYIPKDSKFKIGERFEIVAHKKYSGEKGYLSGYHTNDSPEFWVKLDNYDLQIRVFPDEVKFLEDEKTQEAIALCNCNSNTPASLQESPVLNSELKQPELVTSSRQNSSLKTTPTLKQSSATDSQKSPSTATSATTTLNRENSIFTQLDFLVLEPVAQETVQDSNIQNQPSGLKPCDASLTVAPASSSLKILKGLYIEDYEQFLADSEWLAISGTIRSSYRLRKSERRTKETDSSLLPTPTTYCKGSTGCRPAGQTRLEQKLKPHLAKGDKLNPAVPGWMMGFPVGWAEKVLMDTGETISVQLPFIPEYATTLTNDEIVTTSTPVLSAPCKQRSQSSESVISPNLLTQLKKSDVKVDLYICDRSLNVGIIKSFCSTFFVVDWKTEKDKWYFWERDELYISQLALAQPAAGIAPQSLIAEFLEDKSEPLVLYPSCELQHIYLSGGCGMCGLKPVNFLEEKTGSKFNLGDKVAPGWAAGSGRRGVVEKIEKNFAHIKWSNGTCGKVRFDQLLLVEKAKQDIECTHQFKVDDESLSGDRLSLHAPSHSIECTQELQSVQVGEGLRPTIGQRIRITKTRTQNLSQWIGYEATVTGINDETISVGAGEGREKKHLTLKKGWYELIPKNSSEEKEEAAQLPQQPKPSKQKGCLYKYLENKKLKDGTIASYPRVIGDRKPDNPTHWRWGFNWEEKVDGEWKGRSIGSIPVGAIALIQSMQKEGVSLEEIIGFIRRAKSKKS